MAAEKSSGSGQKRSTSKTTSSKKAAAKKVSAKRSLSGPSSTRASAPRAEASRRLSPPRVAESAARQLAELTSKEVESVTALRRTEDGWQVNVEVLELRRIPNTTDVMATYEVTVGAFGELDGYKRLNRFVRGQAEEGRS